MNYFDLQIREISLIVWGKDSNVIMNLVDPTIESNVGGFRLHYDKTPLSLLSLYQTDLPDILAPLEDIRLLNNIAHTCISHPDDFIAVRIEVKGFFPFSPDDEIFIYPVAFNTCPYPDSVLPQDYEEFFGGAYNVL
jgi:hypothetical protein